MQTPFRSSKTMPQLCADLGPFQVITATGILFDHVDAGGYMWTGSGDRSVRLEIMFAKAFTSIPVVTAHIIGMDCSHDHNLRYWLNAVDIKPFQFTLEFNTWGDTNIARAGVSWSAIGLANKSI